MVMAALIGAGITMGLDPKQYVPVMAIAIGKHDPKAEAEITTTRYSLDELVDFK